jgi:transcriptional regulator with XRE-family HTH domain
MLIEGKLRPGKGAFNKPGKDTPLVVGNEYRGIVSARRRCSAVVHMLLLRLKGLTIPKEELFFNCELKSGSPSGLPKSLESAQVRGFFIGCPGFRENASRKFSNTMHKIYRYHNAHICYTVKSFLKKIRNPWYYLFMNNFGENLRKIRRGKGYTQAQLARMAGISRRMVGHYETQVKRPSVDKVKRISSALKVTDNELLGIQPQAKVQKKSEEGIPYRIAKKMRIVERLPKRDQDMVFSFINSLAEKNKVKGKL